jgi:hypothetical protein
LRDPAETIGELAHGRLFEPGTIRQFHYRKAGLRERRHAQLSLAVRIALKLDPIEGDNTAL